MASRPSHHRRARTLNVSGITLNDRLSATDHVNNLLTSCSSLLYVMRVLRGHGISTESLQDVFRATILAKITYCLPAWSGLCSASDRAKLDSFLTRCKRLGFCDNSIPTISDIFSNADDSLFKAILKNRYHVLYPNLPDKKLSYRQGTARCIVSIEILPIATQQCKNYLCDKF